MVNRMTAHWTINLKHLPVSPAMLFLASAIFFLLIELLAVSYNLLLWASFIYGIGLAIFALIYWVFPLIFRRDLNQRLGFLHFWTTFTLLFLFFFDLLMSSAVKYPKYYYSFGNTESSLIGEWFYSINVQLTILALLVASAQLIFVYNLAYSAFRGKKISQQP